MEEEREEGKQKQQPHFLVVTYRELGHTNPAKGLAVKLAGAGARVTFSTAVVTHRRMFPSSGPDEETMEEEGGGAITYIPYTDGCGDSARLSDPAGFLRQLNSVAGESLAAILRRLSDAGTPVSCVVYTIMCSWAAEVAREHGVPSVQFWIQPATVFAAYYHYFHGNLQLIASSSVDPSTSIDLPGLPASMQIRHLPSFIADPNPNELQSAILPHIRGNFEALDAAAEYNNNNNISSKPVVLVNTFQELELDAVAAMEDKFDMFSVGPMVAQSSTLAAANELEEEEDVDGYIAGWLDRKAERSVVYVSFGSMSVMKKRQVEEMIKGLRESRRPYLWVVRKDNREGEGIDAAEVAAAAGEGLVVGWCSQLRVLNHAAVGCFVTHCGWNSTLESVAAGVPIVAAPQWTDQATNAWLAEAVWGTGVTAQVSGDDGVVEGEELRRCLEVVMGDDQKGQDIRRMAALWRDKAAKAVDGGGSSARNLGAFMEEMDRRRS